MIIDDPESFRTWLTAKLGPLCDADPEALAKYVYALVKKDKPIEELRASMVEQLEVFLQRETQNFVNLLFRTLETQKFELSQENVVPPPSTPAAPPAVTKPALVDVDLREPFSALGTQEETAEKKPLKEANSDGIMATIASSAHNSNSLGCVLLAASNRREPEKHLRKADSDKDDRVPRRIRRRGSSPSPERRRSRSRSFERRRSRSRERDRARAWRNKSPPLRRYDRSRRSFSKSPPRRFSKSGSPQSKRASRRSYSKSPHRRYSKSRSPQSKRIRYRNRSPPHSRSRTRSRTRSRSPLIPGIRDRKDVATGLSPRENHGDTDLRNVQSVVNLPTDLQPPYTRRCRDFDEKGFCVRGDLCPYDHGTDPVVLEDLQMYNGGPAQQPPLIPPTAPPPTHMRHPVHPPMRPPPTVNLIEYNPDAPSMEPRMWARPPSFRGPMMRGMMRGNMGRGGFPTHQRELINVVTGGPHFRHQRPNPNPLNDFSNGRLGNADSKPFDFNRLGGPRAPFNNQKGFTSLQLKKVPPGVNNITHLNSHFSKFGKIVNIQVGFEGDPESALITFSSPTEANIAYKSTEAVLNNRFIRVFWYNPAQNSGNNENKQENTPPTTRPSVLERLGDIPSKVLNNIQPSAVQTDEKAQVTLGVNNSLSKTLYIPSAMKKELPKEQTKENPSGEAKVLPGELLKKKIEQVAVAKKKQQESIKAGLKLNADLRKRKTELLEKQINQQKLLIQRMEAPNVTPQQKAALMETIKTLQDSIENIRKDLESSVKPSAAKVDKTHVVKNQLVPFVKKSREETQRELLDAELDLINSQNEGKNADELKKKVADLKMRAISCGLTTSTTTRGAFRGRGTIRIRGRGRGSKFSSSYDHNVVDHRPTKVLISGYEQDDKADVLTHFEKYGQVVDYISDDATPSLVLNFKSRKEAENAINKGRNFHDRLLSVTWATSNMNIRVGVVTKPPTPVQRSIRVMEDDVIGDDILEVDDDDAFVDLSPAYFPIEGEYEEDEEDEERSWRR